MDLNQLATLVAVAETGSLSAAARERHITQPAVSLQIKALEQELGVRLLDRRGRSTRPTAAGTAVIEHARTALDAARSVRATAADIRGAVTGSIRLGATDAAAMEILPRAFVQFHRRHPGIEVSVEVHATGELLSRLRAGRVDVALGTLPVDAQDVETTVLLTERLGLVAPGDLGRAGLRQLLETQAFIAYPRGSVTRRLVDEALSARDFSSRPVMEIGQPVVSARLVEAGFGISILPESVVADGVARGAVRRVAWKSLRVERQLGLLRAPHRQPEPAVRAFVALLLGDRS